MYKILRKEVLSDIIKLMVVEAPQVARKARAGQFVIVRIGENGERIPLTVADFDRRAGAVTIIFQEVGKSTMHMGSLKEGDGFSTFAGPLGHPTEIGKYGAVICVGGGVGIAPVYPIARALREAGNEVISIIGARSKNLLFWEEKMRSVSSELIVCTDDGTCGRKALVTEPLKELLEMRGKDFSRIWAIGPAVMMKFTAQTTQPYKIPTIVSLNTIMVDGTGMCGGCRVLLDDGAKFVCVDGPEFDAHKVDWKSLLSRLGFYRAEERQAVERWKHKCALDSAAASGSVRNG
ncbi:MAG: sulfide/dihydroorotate dehydrogenase-like FAD/NAD-binding protein [Elusimicrobia bacterium]|nr:sulfide/dihydroorotate dehydrogenase-like FAD/NAD-binding protein [Elusimicrobiota bacterium]